MGNDELTKLNFDNNSDFIDKIVDENIIYKSKELDDINYWALKAITNEKYTFFTSIKNLKEIIKANLSYYNLVEEEREKLVINTFKNMRNILSNSKDERTILGQINWLSVFLTLYNFL